MHVTQATASLAIFSKKFLIDSYQTETDDATRRQYTIE